ncbi:homoprotocatechuate degradation operon regulator, HpaR [Nocardia otitidiscaviarum]|uniref:Homoprotocatechuate degradation operon regulator, HpaR n=1 Tax=Nocardia otitidiscaviarum TaxID=1823 RepID=A0A378Y8Z4_9NOCA|nr:MarR family transcriptional regulator [Nocardia otitidiscaviarum]MBF6241597.1 MarR family transcriptional regulator [Nocardia otitidiscaviarum]SUA72829.1 homoprotocatechuate degradation operon regulator, HpaR [Nocardia otitidiscaviarum]
MTKHSAADMPTTPPALVYLLAQSNSAKLTDFFVEQGMADLLPRHALQLFPLLLGGGLRASDLAARLGVSRQAAAQVVGTLERAGYITRVDDPGDGRAKLVCLTARGRAATRVLGTSMRALERDWEKRLGRERMADLREMLTLLSRPDR